VEKIRRDKPRVLQLAFKLAMIERSLRLLQRKAIWNLFSFLRILEKHFFLYCAHEMGLIND
jgi:hypothetical protein